MLLYLIIVTAVGLPIYYIVYLIKKYYYKVDEEDLK